MRTVHKYAFPFDDVVTLLLPTGADILTVQMQHGRPQLWALVDPSQPLAPRHFRVAGTGHPIQEAFTLRFLTTLQLDGGALVFHVFEILEKTS